MTHYLNGDSTKVEIPPETIKVGGSIGGTCPGVMS